MERSKIRRKDRAITDYHRMLEIMKQCDICCCIQPLNMRNIKTNRDWAGIFGNKRDEYR